MSLIPTEAQNLAIAASMGAGYTPGDVGAFALGGVPTPYVKNSFSVTNLARFDTKITYGDFSKDSDNLMSTYVRSTFTGGALIDDHQEGVTDTRFRFSTLHTRSPGQLALLADDFAAVEAAAPDPDDVVYPIGDYDDAYYTVIGLDLLQQAGIPDAPDDATIIGTLAAAPVERGTIYKGKLYIPLGPSNIAVYDGASITTIAIHAVSLVVWDNKLFALTTAGVLRKSSDGTTFDAVADAKTLPTDRVPRKLVWFYDRNGTPTVFVATDQDLWGWEPDTDVIHPTRLRMPRHPDNGLAVCEWRDDALYYSAGLGLYRYTASGTISAVGPDRDDGLPAQYHGRIIDLIAEHNGLIALIEGVQDEVVPPDPSFAMDSGPRSGPQTFDTTQRRSLNLIMMWNEAGWHTLWAGEQSVTQTWLALSQVRIPNSTYVLDYGIHFGVTDASNDPVDRFIPFPKYFFGPKKLLTLNSFPFRATGTHQDGRFDSGMKGFPKLASHAEVNLVDPEDGIPAEGTVDIYYATDRFAGWRLLGQASAYGRTVLPFGVTTSGFSEGEPFTWFEPRFDITRGATATRTPVVDSIVLKYLKLPLAGQSWTVSIPLDWEGEWLGQTAASIRNHLVAQTTAEAFTTMQTSEGGPSYRVRVAQTQGRQPTGGDSRGAMQISILHVPITGEASYG